MQALLDAAPKDESKDEPFTLAGTDETARLVAQGGGSRTLMTLVNALLQHPYDAGVQQFGLWAVSNLAMAGSDIARRLKKAGLPEICRISNIFKYILRNSEKNSSKSAQNSTKIVLKL